ncbi:peroxiredoxin [Mameliella sediminis]|uniref:peroxiredoxin n=1 Tax=Mameliella sediminis TaxID=2836866 RepID=UPI001C47A68C|nr:peroxiredoxin [Mameliella sediminis]MBY6113927.1 peroxiredoxin [Antarctobacter heliothermus]MBY6142725.1 peroxiredoxin [Mameliella alba]MBV7395224.1 peroxiredoxin [Mameliella sediminis]MBY6159580.1 peroxiredoxin [Mameliella alba]MBY6168051.1 peroxiredoxin [Mameliella alba]
MTPHYVPETVFHTRVRNEALGGDNPYEWKSVSSTDLFGAQRVVLFALPGAFTPACSETHLPGYERLHDEFIAAGMDRVICLSVNDAFVMRQWAKSLGISKVEMLPDGNGAFSRQMGMLVDRSAQGMGLRSWRYSMLVEDREITALFSEPGKQDNPPGVPVKLSGAETMLQRVRLNKSHNI